MGSVADVDKAVKAARKAFASWSQTSRKQRLDVLLAIQASMRSARMNRRSHHRGNGRTGGTRLRLAAGLRPAGERLRAAFTALSTSATEPMEMQPETSSVAGLITFDDFGSIGSTHLPSI